MSSTMLCVVAQLSIILMSISLLQAATLFNANNANSGQDQHNWTLKVGDECEEQAEREHCKFYSCMDELTACGSNVHYHSFGHRLCVQSRHEQEMLTPKGMKWVADTNRCMMETLVELHAAHADSWCWRTDDVIRSTFVTCAAENDICDILWSDREMIQRIFHDGSWLTAVEAAKECPRHIVNRFIFWNMSHSTHFR